eukprot:CAMPEP_0196717784 /NCGR_PEP_ID=MMETSP1091-20130531/1133_1 /TAXON_ID=302021 /ORGANISM="Rhodomonas sp., Strain CCMP768" /LENGTH=984 /DNA_ID=CAMNT_0042058271 /DNA_START=44 /DNA_END=2998 /DNA_ORIENTATION=+
MVCKIIIAVVLALCYVHCIEAQAYFGADQVFDAFTFEGEMEITSAHNLEITLVNDLGGASKWREWVWVDGVWRFYKYFIKIQIIPIQASVRIGVFYKWTTSAGASGQDWLNAVQEFKSLPGNWFHPGFEYYWKLQVDAGGYRIHLNDLQVSTTVTYFSSSVTGVKCCDYPLNQDITDNALRNVEWGSGTEATFDRSLAAVFTKDFPCINPCSVARIRWLFNCDPSDNHGLTWSPYPINVKCLDDVDTHALYASARAPNCDVLDFTVNPTSVPDYWQNAGSDRVYVNNWCAVVGITCHYNATTGIYYDVNCPDPSERWLAEQNSRRSMISSKSRRHHRKDQKERKTSGKSRMAARRAGYGHGQVSGLVSDRRKAKNEKFVFNHQYLHPVCWELEDIMYLNQHSEHFPALFYWCYGALWCFQENKVCNRGGATGHLRLRHEFESRMNACLAVRGKIWTDLQIKEVLLNNFSNSSFDLKVTNNTIYAVAPIPASELEDTEPSFLTRLPLYQSLFGAPNCSTEDRQYQACYFAEGVPDFMFYRYKNMEYLRDWIDGVNYNVWLSQRRREYGIPKSKFDHKRYCNIFGYMCDPNALCNSRRKWPGYRCKCNEAAGYYGDGYFCTKAQTFAYAQFQIVTSVSINSTLDKIAAKFESITKMPREALDISSYVDVDALTASLGGTEVFLTMKYPTIDNQNEFDAWTLLTDTTMPTKMLALKKELAKRKRYESDPEQDLDSFNTERWQYGDVNVFQNPEDPDDFKVQHPAPSLATFQEVLQFTVHVEEGDDATEVEVKVGDNHTYGGGGPSSRAAKAAAEMGASQGVFVAEPVKAEPRGDAVLAETEEPAKDKAEPTTGGGRDLTTAPLLIAGGSVAGVVLLVAVGWTMHKRSSPTEKEAAVMAVHELRSLEHATVEMESAPSDDGEEAAQSKAPHGSVKDRWRSNKGGGEDSFTLAQDRSGIWNADASAKSKPSRPEDSFKKAQDGSGIWNR